MAFPARAHHRVGQQGVAVFDDQDALMAGAEAMAGEIAANAPLAVEASNRTVAK